MFCIPGQGLHHSGGLLHLLWDFLRHGGSAAVRGSDGDSGYREVLQRDRPGPAHGGHCRVGGPTWCRWVITKQLAELQHPLYSLLIRLHSRLDFDKIKSKGLRISPLSKGLSTTCYCPLFAISLKTAAPPLSPSGADEKILSRQPI